MFYQRDADHQRSFEEKRILSPNSETLADFWRKEAGRHSGTGTQKQGRHWFIRRSHFSLFRHKGANKSYWKQEEKERKEGKRKNWEKTRGECPSGTISSVESTIWKNPAFVSIRQMKLREQSSRTTFVFLREKVFQCLKAISNHLDVAGIIGNCAKSTY